MPTFKDWRERALLSQGELAKAAGVNRQTVYSWESGRKRPKPEHKRKLVEIFKCTPDELLAALRETQEVREKRKQETVEERPAA
jgi:DNA-binding XRE family transcriptional regulator